MLLHSIRAFSPFGEIIVGANPDYFDKIKSLSSSALLSLSGRDRNATIKNALDYITEHCDPAPGDIILIHDAARPYITAELIGRVIAAVEQHGAASPAIPAADTGLIADAQHFVTNVPDRNTLYQAQTPQGVTFEIMQQLYAEPSHSTDLCGLCVQNGIPVKIIPGDIQNIKITYKEDLL